MRVVRGMGAGALEGIHVFHGGFAEPAGFQVRTLAPFEDRERGRLVAVFGGEANLIGHKHPIKTFKVQGVHLLAHRSFFVKKHEANPGVVLHAEVGVDMVVGHRGGGLGDAADKVAFLAIDSFFALVAVGEVLAQGGGT